MTAVKASERRGKRRSRLALSLTLMVNFPIMITTLTMMLVVVFDQNS